MVCIIESTQGRDLLRGANNSPMANNTQLFIQNFLCVNDCGIIGEIVSDSQNGILFA